jgi:hypothetical protein
MLIRRAALEAIRAGEVTLQFRRWRRPTAKGGGTLTTSIGVLSIATVERIDEADISTTDAHLAGHVSRDALLSELNRHGGGDLYRIQLAYAGDDPRIRLRGENRLTEDEVATLRRRLERLDAASRAGPWTRRVLTAIARRPRVPAAELATRLQLEKDWLKPAVRKLKNLGLTISHHPGYTLSPRGVAVLERLRPGGSTPPRQKRR